MYSIIKSLHSNLALVLLFVLFAAVIYILIGFMGNKEFTASSKRIALAGLIAAHLQLVVGLIIYFISPLGIENFSKASMGNSMSRLYMLEHPLMMLLAIVSITIGYSKSKRAATDKQKYKLLSIFYVIGLVFILSRIPWHVWM
ncbi:hypothetical protein [Cytophaga hutchinsonii]|jgi:nitric oxide reductase large subunit|uniref:50S ribosomal protein L27 n=1 Tax=Cytophaga hutchinsonii (strain ATCC 33406 / DSM 1761 / CIP 103989 / NBRC 15051 / NCIMB 9469 / D465) TaxID=269798 RepID=A0A6N4STP9_CYTH3|nr:hypothetical protein [Cytophaga hutchinsonii]ABG59808.1 conserved hypothetical protein [Cytophaga hutchinsonii ATCC 33406]SFX29457.1 hypothetical protein SAMN04487930_102495 [Cytophaga hutchinsonii ATCC 33406]